MGSPYFMLFLNKYVNQDWKDKFIHSFTSLSGPFGGSTFAVTAVVSTQPMIPDIDLTKLLQSWGSLEWVMPTVQTFGDKIFIKTPNSSYSSKDWQRLFKDANLPIPAKVLANQDELRNSVEAPGVAVNCVYGYNISTYATATLNSTWGIPSSTYEDGDGTVLTPSLSLCESWQKDQKQPVRSYRIANMIHADAIRNPEALRIFVDSLFN